MLTLHTSVGSNGVNLREDVQVVQSYLRSRGYPIGTIDGVCGPRTIAGIRKVQSHFKRQPTGVIDPGDVSWLVLTSDSPAPAATPTAAEWGGDSARWPQEKKIQSLNPLLRPKVRNILDTLKKQGYQPKVFYGWRSVAVQLEIVKAGNSTVKFSFHNAQKSDGTPNAYAADIVDSRYGWAKAAETAGFWKALGAEAKKQGLVWGGDWKKFTDVAHVQLVPNSQLGPVKRESGL
jgi:peptidoglycan hydrolase-like protein with peptidoglycan-binding domain